MLFYDLRYGLTIFLTRFWATVKILSAHQNIIRHFKMHLNTIILPIFKLVILIKFIGKKAVQGREPWSSGLREGTCNQKVVSSNPGAGYWMDIFSHLFVIRIVMFV